MSKRVKINCDIMIKGKHKIIPPDKIHESNERIKKAMKDFKRRNR